jgi:hypothetical protein
MKNSNWNKSSKWVKKERTTDFIGTLPEGVATATLVQTKSTWSVPRQCKIGEDTMTLLVTKIDGSIEKSEMSLDIYAAKKAAAELLGAAPKPTTPTELTAAQAQAMGLVYHDENGDARGYCYCCGRTGFKVNAAGRLSHHGYERPGWGYLVGGCSGTDHTPEETLDIGIKDALWFEESFAKDLATDLYDETLKRLDWGARNSSFFGRRNLEKFKSADNAHFVEEQINETRRDLEFRRKRNLRWLAQLERVKAAQV